MRCAVMYVMAMMNVCDGIFDNKQCLRTSNLSDFHVLVSRLAPFLIWGQSYKQTPATYAGQQRSPLPEALHPKAAAQAAANAARAAAAFQQQRPIGKLMQPCLDHGLSSSVTVSLCLEHSLCVTSKPAFLSVQAIASSPGAFVN